MAGYYIDGTYPRLAHRTCINQQITVPAGTLKYQIKTNCYYWMSPVKWVSDPYRVNK